MFSIFVNWSEYWDSLHEWVSLTFFLGLHCGCQTSLCQFALFYLPGRPYLQLFNLLCFLLKEPPGFSMGLQITAHHNFVFSSGLLYVTAFCHRISFFLSSLEITYLHGLKDPICVVWSSTRWGLTVILCPTNPFAFPPLSSSLQGSRVNEKNLMISPTV